MIFYFSGTGNSKHVAQTLSGLIGDNEVINIADFHDDIANKKDVKITVKNDGFLGFVSPVHSWGLALTVKRFLERLRIQNPQSIKKIFSVFVCGDTCGKAMEMMNERLKKYNNIQLDFYCSVQMPNNYIVMKGFGTDPKELEQQKLSKAEIEIPKIADAILNGSEYKNYVIGPKPFLKGRIIYPLFMKFTLGDKKFFADNNCNGCGLCEKTCPEKNIKLENNRPKWLGHCVKCLACIHRCPKTAIQYGDITQTMGRYYFKSKK